MVYISHKLDEIYAQIAEELRGQYLNASIYPEPEISGAWAKAGLARKAAPSIRPAHAMKRARFMD